MVGQMDINTCIVSVMNNQNINVNSRSKIVIKFVEKLLKYRLMFKDILTFLGLDYRDASLITMFFVVLGISILKNQINGIILSHRNLLLKK